MANIFRKGQEFARDIQRQYKSLGNIGPGGTEVWAPIFALEPASIGGGGGGGGGIVQQGAKDASSQSWDVSVTNASIPVTGTFFQATQPVSGPLTDAQLRAAVVPTLDTAVRDRLPSALGQTTMVNSLAVVLASNQSAIPVTGTFFQATQPVSLAAAVPVTDNAGSLTVDAPVGTPVFARLSDGAAALIGQKVMASSLPVVIASDQTLVVATHAVTGSGTFTTDPSDRAARELGRARLWDGTDEMTIIPVRTQPATSEKAIPIFDIPNRLATYSCTLATQTPAITVGVKELLAIWNAAANLKDKYIVEIWVTYVVTTASTAGRSAIRVSTITTAPTGGAELGKADVGGAGASDMTNTMSVKTGGGTIGTTFIRKLVEHTVMPLGTYEKTIFSASNPGNGIILRGGANAGISIDLEREVAHTALVDLWTVGVRWLEI